MKVNARTEEFQHIEVFDKPALFTNGRIARDTVPKGWYCYDIRGSDDVWGDRIFEKCGIRRDEGGDGGKTLEIRGKQRLSARDEGANYQQS